MSIRNTPVIADSDTLNKLKIAEDLCIFFEDQKLKAQNRIRECESFLNNLHLPSKSVKEGMFLFKLIGVCNFCHDDFNQFSSYKSS